MHALAEFGELRRGAFALEQIAAELGFELLDGAGQRGLGDVALVGRAREIQDAADREEVAYLVHFHKSAPSEIAR